MEIFPVIFIFFTALLSLLFSLLLLYKKREVGSFSVFLMLSLVLITHGLSVLTVGPQITLVCRKLSLAMLSLLAVSYSYYGLTFKRGAKYDKPVLGKSQELVVERDYKLWLPMALPVGVFLFSLFSIPSSGVIKEVVSGVENTFYVYGSLGKPFILALSLALAGAIVNLEWIYHAAKGSAKWRVKYLVWGLVWGLAFCLFFLGYPLLYGLESASVVEAGAISIALSFYPASYVILKRKALDTGLYVSREVAYGSLVVVVLGVYFISLGLFLKVFNYHKVSLPQLALLAFFLSIVGVSIAFSESFRRRATYFISRHFYSGKYDYRKVWGEFNKEASNHWNLESIIPPLSETVAEIVGAKWVAYFEKLSAEPLASTQDVSDRMNEAGWKHIYGEPLTLPADVIQENLIKERVLPVIVPNGSYHDYVILSLRGKEETLGLLVLGPKISGDAYEAEDMEMLGTLSEQAGMRIYQVKLAQEMASYKELESLGKLSAFLLHDLKNVASTLSMILKDAPRHLHDTSFQEDLLLILKNTEESIRGLMTKVSIFPGGLEPQQGYGSLNDLLSRVVERFDKNGKISVELRSDADLNFYFDESLLEKLFTNVILNAIEAIQESGKGEKIKIGALAVGDSVAVKIEDDGPGITAGALRGGLFKPFYTTKKRGTGIGLYQSRLIAEAHGGTIQVKSEEGKGTEFTVLIPVRRQQKLWRKSFSL